MVKQQQAGFTLIELLVAMTIFATISAITYQSLQTVVSVNHHAGSQASQLAGIQRVIGLMERDFLQLAPRPIHNEFGQQDAAVVIESIPFARIEFTRTGVSNPLNLNKSSLMRVAYVFEESNLKRLTWKVLDRTAQTQAAYEEVLLENVKSVSFRGWFDKGWLERWPLAARAILPGEAEADPLSGLPRAVELTLEIEGEPAVHRLFPGAGG